MILVLKMTKKYHLTWYWCQNIRDSMVEKRVKKLRQGSPHPPFFGQCPKEKNFLSGGAPLTHDSWVMNHLLGDQHQVLNDEWPHDTIPKATIGRSQHLIGLGFSKCPEFLCVHMLRMNHPWCHPLAPPTSPSATSLVATPCLPLPSTQTTCKHNNLIIILESVVIFCHWC